MSKVRTLTEDEVRDGYTDGNEFHKGAKQILGFDIPDKDVQQGTGQIMTFKQLGFNCLNNNHKPDGWYLPNDKSKIAIILETKAEKEDLSKQKWVEELLLNVNIARKKYKNVVGILYNGTANTRVFINDNEEINCTKILQPKEFYIDLFNNKPIDTKQIYDITMRINNNLHYKFGVNDYYDRMIFTACALVAKRYNAPLTKGMTYNLFHYTILDTLSKSLDEAIKQNEKLKILIEKYSTIQMNITNNQEAIDSFIEDVEEISDLINSNKWNGEDVMGIFFNEFNRYKGKSENGQVFTPDNVTSLMYRLIDVNQNDRVLDAACGSGAFLTKAMSNMIDESGGIGTIKAKKIMSEQLYGIEIDKRVFSLACANMLIHKDGKTNLEQMDTTSEEACRWIASKNITKVLMNPPYEKKCHPDIIVQNVLNNVSDGTMAAFLLPDKKLEKVSKKRVKDILSRHRLLKIIKLPEKTFDEGVTTSIFIFKTGIPQNDEEIFTCYIKDDGYERVKNQGRQDIRHKWKSIEDNWVNIIKKQTGDDSIKWIKPSEHLSYQVDIPPFEVSEEEFSKTMIDYLMFKEEIDVKELKDTIAQKILYNSEIKQSDIRKEIEIKLKGKDENDA